MIAARFRLAAFLAFGLVPVAPAQALPTIELNEVVIRVPVTSGPAGRERTDWIDATAYRPEGTGPFPLVVISHGSPRTVAERRRGGRVRYEAPSRAFLALGYAVLVPTRRGYGDSQGEWSEGYGSCERPDYHAAGLETARDILSAVEAARALPWIDTGRVVLVGQSAGGWGSVAAATAPFMGLTGVINFAGGRGSYAAHAVCAPEGLVEAAGRYGRRSTVPQLWIYSANDAYFDPVLSSRMHGAFVASGGRAEFVRAPAVGADGHGYFSQAVGDWTPAVARFLRAALNPEAASSRAAGNNATRP